MKAVAVAAVLVGLSSQALAGGPGCDHPNFYVKGCQYEELQGATGSPGRDGIDGAPGRDGNDGRNGSDGRNGTNGKDGRDGIDGSNKYSRDFQDYVNATSAIQLHLPRTEPNRLTLGVAGGNGDAGVGLGYARRLDDSTDFTVGLGRSSGETVWQIGVSGEF